MFAPSRSARSKIRMGHLRAIQDCQAQCGLAEIGASHIRFGEKRPGEIRLKEVRVRQKNSVTLRVTKSRIVEPRPLHGRDLLVRACPSVGPRRNRGLGQICVWVVSDRPENARSPPPDVRRGELWRSAGVVRNPFHGAEREKQKQHHESRQQV